MMLVGPDNKVVARSTSIDAPEAKLVDHAGKYLLPKYVDAHLHILPMGLHLTKPSLLGANSHEEVFERLLAALPNCGPGEWLHAVQYDQTRFLNGHITLTELDKVSQDIPILLRHSNGHASVANTAALRAAGIAEDVENPEGGVFERDSSGRLTGVLLELAHERVSKALPKPNLEAMVEAIFAADKVLAERGIGTATDMMTGHIDLELELQAYHIASQRGQVRYRLYVQWRDLFGPRALDRDRLCDLTDAMQTDRCKVSGAKIFADGAIASATAAIYGKYVGDGAGGPRISSGGVSASSFTVRENSGQLIYAPERLVDMVETADSAGYQIAIHAIGDLAVDLVLDAYALTSQAYKHRLEHAMILSDEQISHVAELGVPINFQPEFLEHFGHAYEKQLGPERKSQLKRLNSCLKAGVAISLGSDTPIVDGFPDRAVKLAVQRPDGFDQAENLTIEQALFAATAAGADINGDRGMYGRLAPGEFAEFRILEELPH